ncbi:MAG: UPF0175 family protein [Candidatus Methanoperedens sp.]|nr:UPF0175 family protein [Candidatus Methanoperedens sp.]
MANTSLPDELLIDHALVHYRNGNITLGRAAKIAGISLREMIAIAAKRRIPFQYSLDDLHEDLHAAEDMR